MVLWLVVGTCTWTVLLYSNSVLQAKVAWHAWEGKPCRRTIASAAGTDLDLIGPETQDGESVD
jgi:hypothetical protein